MGDGFIFCVSFDMWINRTLVQYRTVRSYGLFLCTTPHSVLVDFHNPSTTESGSYIGWKSHVSSALSIEKTVCKQLYVFAALPCSHPLCLPAGTSARVSTAAQAALRMVGYPLLFFPRCSSAQMVRAATCSS